jgi:hypothetical protein
MGFFLVSPNLHALCLDYPNFTSPPSRLNALSFPHLPAFTLSNPTPNPKPSSFSRLPDSPYLKPLFSPAGSWKHATFIGAKGSSAIIRLAPQLKTFSLGRSLTEPSLHNLIAIFRSFTFLENLTLNDDQEILPSLKPFLPDSPVSASAPRSTR